MSYDENQFPERERVSPTDETVPNESLRISHTFGAAPALRPGPEAFRRRETFSPSMTIFLIVLAIVLIGGGFGFILYAATTQYRATLHSEATTEAHLTAQAILATQIRNQATANAFATANTHIYATATAQVGATATLTALAANATATATTLASIFTQATSGTSALNDPLSDNTGNHKWDQTSTRVDGMCVFTGGDYHALAARQGFFQPCLAQTTNFSDFAYQVQMTTDTGTQDGIIFRANSITGSFYLFRIGIDSTYALDLYHNSKLALTLSSGYSAAIATGLKQSNEIAVIAYKGTIYLYANQQFITSVSDNSLNSGKIGVAAIDYSIPTQAEFSNAQVWKISATSFSLTPSPSASPTATSTASPTASPSPSTTASPSATYTPTP